MAPSDVSIKQNQGHGNSHSQSVSHAHSNAEGRTSDKTNALRASKRTKKNSSSHPSEKVQASEKRTERMNDSVSVSITSEGAKLSTDRFAGIPTGSKDSAESASRTVRYTLGKAFDQYKKSEIDSSRFFENMQQAQAPERKGILSALKEMYSKLNESNQDRSPGGASEEWQQAAPTEGQIPKQTFMSVNPGSDEKGVKLSLPETEVADIKSSHGQIVVTGMQSGERSAGVEEKSAGGTLGAAPDLNLAATESSHHLSSLLRGISEKLNASDTEPAMVLGAVMQNAMQTEMKIPSPFENTDEPPAFGIKTAGEDKPGFAPTFQAPATSDKDNWKAAEKAAWPPAEDEDKKVKDDEQNAQKVDKIETPGIVKARTVIFSNAKDTVPPGQLKKLDEKDTDPVKPADEEKIGNKTPIDEPFVKLNQVLKGLQKLDPDRSSPDENVPAPVFGRPASTQEQSQSTGMFKGSVRVKGADGGTGTISAGGPVIHFAHRGDNEGSDGSVSYTGRHHLPSLFADTAYGRNAALSTYRGVQSYIG